jgi:hypothetical protein
MMRKQGTSAVFAGANDSLASQLRRDASRGRPALELANGRRRIGKPPVVCRENSASPLENPRTGANL